MLIQPIILSGGSGTRLWPLSREKYPKQLLPLVSEDSLLQATIRRVDGLPGAELAAPMVVCNEEYRFVIAEQLRQMSRPGRIVLEPCGRNTAPALTLAALAAVEGGADPVLLVMPSDHVIADTAAFQKVVRHGARLAEAGNVVTFGITPDAPETGYGYIQSGSAADSDNACRIARFVEKPDRATAQGYLDAGNYLWNSGLFMMRASVWLAAIARCRADILVACEKAWTEGAADGDFRRVGAETFAACPSDSIDYAVMERTDRAAMVPLECGWSDVGSWGALWQTGAADEHGNVCRGDVILHDVANTYVHAESRLVAAVGLEDVVIVETADAVLVTDKDASQDVKHIVARLKEARRSEALNHKRVYRPWGSYESLVESGRFQVKRIIVEPGQQLSLQMHHHRAEHWIVVKGTAHVTCGEQEIMLREDQSTYIPLGTKHRLANPGKIPLELIEVQTGSYLGEDDIVRFTDVYGRAPV